ncbi:MAG TPA: ABC transporter ATP-binding protein [Afipia sp.]|nr:ABC transporter ATP-binding protein [Afipia sp.]
MNNAAGSPVLTVKNLEAWYGESHILHGMNFDVRSGEVVTLLGRNGAGKTSTLKSIMGIIGKRTGSVAFEGAELIKLPSEKIARLGVAFCPEERGIFASLDVKENLMLPPTIRSGGMTLDQIFELFPNLKERLGSQGTKLSGGEQQMLTIGRALMTNPDLILIDEATEGLAPLVAKDIWNTLGVIRSEGVATVVVDKDFRALSRIADRMVMLSKGTVVFDGTPAALAEKQDLLEQHLGV